MNNIGSISLTDEKTERNKQPADDAHSNFRRRTLITGRWSCPRRYVIALLLCIVLLIQVSSRMNVFLTLGYIVENDSSGVNYSSIGNWTIAELESLSRFMQIGDIFAPLIGALVIYEVSSHKFILASVTTSSILYMLMPAALEHHSDSFLLIVIIGHDVVSVSLFIAALSIWKDWSPPEERIRLVMISLCALIMEGTAAIFYLLLNLYIGEMLNYYLGAAGIIWVLFWYNITSDTPQNDPLISEKEYFYLESTIPTNMQEKIKLKDVPWVSIAKCKQIYILCAVFFKLACSVQTIQVVGIFLYFHLQHVAIDSHMALLLPFVCALGVILIGVSVAMDFLIKRNQTYNLKIRKYFLCGGYLLQCILMVAAVIVSSQYTKGIFFILAFSAFALSVPGCLTYPLDLSPRYVPLIAGIALAFFYFGSFSFYYFIEKVFKSIGDDRIPWLFLLDGIISLTTAIVFGIWGDVEEQQWSLVSSSRHRSHDYTSYPKPDDDEDLNLVEVHA